MTKKDLKEKYKNTLLAMFNAGEKGDNDELFDKLVYMAKKKEDPEKFPDTYKGILEGFDFAAFMEDYKTLL